MSDYTSDWKWTCAGCAATTKLHINIAGRNLRDSPNPARYIANEKLLLERAAARDHAGRCKRPV